MKINTFTALLSMALVGIIAFFLSFYVIGENKMTLGIGSFLSLAITFVGAVSLSFDYDRTTFLTRIISVVFFLLLLVSQIIFTVLQSFLLPTYVLATGCTAILYVLIIYGISRSKH